MIKVPSVIAGHLQTLRESNRCNLWDAGSSCKVASDMGLSALVDWMKTNSDDYAEAVRSGWESDKPAPKKIVASPSKNEKVAVKKPKPKPPK